jgi:hypothetical protein
MHEGGTLTKRVAASENGRGCEPFIMHDQYIPKFILPVGRENDPTLEAYLLFDPGGAMDSFIRIVPQFWENQSLENPLTLTPPETHRLEQVADEI